VPNRFRFGYGLTPQIVALAVTRRPSLIVTVDNGVSSVAGVEAARDLGVPVLVTDHHLPGAALPRAEVIVNPNLANCRFASSALAGVGVAFYVVAALARELAQDDFIACLLADEPAEDGTLRGSARSIHGVNIRDALDSIATRHPGLIEKFGGHAMAAGMSLPKDNLATFKTAFAAEIAERADRETLTGVIHSDGELAPAELSLDLARVLRGAGPIEAIAFGYVGGAAEDPQLRNGARVQLAYRLEVKDGVGARRQRDHGPVKQPRRQIPDENLAAEAEHPYHPWSSGLYGPGPHMRRRARPECAQWVIFST